MTTPDPLALAEQIQRERDSFIPGTELLRAWSQRHPAVTRLAEDYTERDMIDPACNYHDYGGWALRVIDAALLDALTGGK